GRTPISTVRTGAWELGPWTERSRWAPRPGTSPGHGRPRSAPAPAADPQSSRTCRPLSVTVSSGSRTPRVGIEPGGPPVPVEGPRARHRGGANRPGARAFCGHRTEANPTFRPLRPGAVTTNGESQARVSVDERLSLHPQPGVGGLLDHGSGLLRGVHPVDGLAVEVGGGVGEDDDV